MDSSGRPVTEKVGCSFSPSKVSRPPAVVAVSPRKQRRSPKISFLLPHSCVYSAAGTGLYRPGCFPSQSKSFWTPASLLSYSPVDGPASFRQINVFFLLLSNSLFPVHCTDPAPCASCSPSPIVLPPAGLSQTPLARAPSWSSR